MLTKNFNNATTNNNSFSGALQGVVENGSQAVVINSEVKASILSRIACQASKSENKFFRICGLIFECLQVGVSNNIIVMGQKGCVTESAGALKEISETEHTQEVELKKLEWVMIKEAVVGPFLWAFHNTTEILDKVKAIRKANQEMRKEDLLAWNTREEIRIKHEIKIAKLQKELEQIQNSNKSAAADQDQQNQDQNSNNQEQQNQNQNQ